MSNININSGNMITGFGGSNSEKVDLDKIKEALNARSAPRDSAPKIANSRDKSVKNVTSKNLNNLDSIDIKESWEKVKLPTRTNSSGVFDSKSVIPAREGKTSDYGGRSAVSSALNSIFDPDRQKRVAKENGKMGEQIKSDAKRRKEEIQAKHQKSNDWERVEGAKRSKDLRPAQMGFMPNRSEIKQYDIPKVKISEVEKIKEQKKKSEEAGKQAASIKQKLDNIFKVRYEKDANDKRSWEQIQSDKIARDQTKKIKVQESSIKISKDDIKLNLKNKVEAQIDDKIKNIFSTPNFEEKDIKKKSSIKNDRKKREDDRSWERVSPPKKTW